MATITGTNGSDSITGTGASEVINSGNGDDCVNGGGGSDQVNGGAGNDTLVYCLAENLGGSKDVYTGGSGVDTVRLLLTYQEWCNSDIRCELEKYLKFLSTVKTSMQGEVSNGSASDFVFTFGTSTLTVQMMEKLAVWVQPEGGVDYAPIDYRASLITGVTSGTAIEDGGVRNSTVGIPTVSGQLRSDDLDGADNVFKSVSAGAAEFGTYAVTADGQWSYSLNNADSRVQELRASDTLSDSITVFSADGSSKVIAITIKGSNDAPEVTAALSGGAVEGYWSYTLNLLTGASDVDQGETATLRVTGVSYKVDGLAVDGVPSGVSLSEHILSVNSKDSAFDHLAYGEKSIIVVSYKVMDAQGATVDQSATITINGTNDVPTVSAALSSTDAEGNTAFTMNLLAGASDVDDGETDSLSVTDVSYRVNDGSISTSAPDGVSVVAHTLSVNPAHSAFDYLAVGDEVTITITYKVQDVHGATVDQSATITINGTNDVPTVSAALSATEDEGNTAFTMNLLAGAGDADDGETDSLSVTDVSYRVNDGAVSSSAPEGVSVVAHTLSVNPAHSAFDYLAVGDEVTITVSYKVQDVHGAIVDQSATITINGTNDVPTVSAALSATEDEGNTAFTMNLLAGAGDADDGETDSLSVTDVSYRVNDGAVSSSAPDGVSVVAHTLSVNPAHSAFDYLAVGDEVTITVSYKVQDVHGATVDQCATITINGTNDVPTVSGALSSTDAEGNTTFTMNLLAGAGDADDGETDSLSVTDVSYRVNDGAVSSSAPDGVSLVDHTLSVNPAHSAFDYLAVGDEVMITVSYRVQDVHGATVDQSATITINGTNDVPTVSAALSAMEDEGNAAFTMNLLAGASDADDGETDSLSVTDVSYTVNGGAVSSSTPDGVSLVDHTLSVNPAHSAFDYLAVGDEVTITVSYKVQDVHGATVDQSATITIKGTNDVPTVSAELSATEAEGNASFTMNLLAGTSDADVGETDSLSVKDVSYSVNGGVVSSSTPDGVSLVEHTLSVNPAHSTFDYLAVGEHSTIVVNYFVKDAQGATVAQSATITVTGTNDVPVVTGPVTASVTEDGGMVTLNALANASDVDHGTALDVAMAPTPLPAGVNYDAATHSFTLDTSRATYQSMGAGETKEVMVEYGVSDGIATVAESLKFTIIGINDAPVLTSAATPVLANVLQNAGGPSGAVGTLVSSLVNLNPPSGGLDNVSDADNGATTGIALTGTNNANGTWWYSTNGGATWSTVGSVSNSSALLLSADANTRVYFQGNSSFSGTVNDGVTFRAWDGTSGTAGTKIDTSVNGGSSAFSTGTDIAGITVVANNQPPVGVADRLIVSNNTLVTISTSALLGNDTDIDGYALTITGVSGGTGITGLTLNASAGTISFTSNNNATSGSFQYTVSDGAGGSATASVAIDIRTATNNNSTGDTIDLSTAGTYQASYIDAGGGPDVVTGGAAGDVFIGGTGNAADTLNGSAGNDLLSGNGGDDQLSGGAGNDVLAGGLGDDKLDGGAGSEDMLDFSDGTAALNFSLGQSGIFTGTGGAGGLGADTYANMEGVIGTGLADIINGSAGNDIIRGGAGNDSLDGKGGSDLLDFSDGNAGINFTLINNGTGTFAGSAAGLGTDTYTGFEGAIGTAFADNLTGSAVSDQLRGGGGNDLISGMSGDDRIVGGLGSDMLTGGAGRDTFVFDTAPNAVDSVTDFNASGSAASGDWIELSLAAFTGITTAAGNLLSSSEFAAGAATDVVAGGVRVIYDSTTGNLYYDADGLGAANRTLFATLTLENPADAFNQNDIRVGS